MQTSKECVIVLAKAPVEGQVKTRLAADIGPKAAAGLYRAFVADLLQMLGKTDYSIHVHFTPSDAELQMKQWLGSAYEFVPQADGGLGERMAAAFKHGFSNHFSRVLLIGADFPDLPASFIHEAFNTLLINEAVLGPSHDGGYYLIGFNREGFVPGCSRILRGALRMYFPTPRNYLKSITPLFIIWPGGGILTRIRI